MTRALRPEPDRARTGRVRARPCSTVPTTVRPHRLGGAAGPV